MGGSRRQVVARRRVPAALWRAVGCAALEPPEVAGSACRASHRSSACNTAARSSAAGTGYLSTAIAPSRSASLARSG